MTSKTVYVARVKDTSKKNPIAGGKAFRVTTNSNRAGQFSMRKTAEAMLEKALKNDPSLVSQGVQTEQVTGKQRYQDWLTGKVVDPKDVPTQYRAAYIDTLERATAAAVEYGHVLHVDESFRTYAEQEHFWAIYKAGGALAARPGTSNHERGLALDIPNVRQTPALHAAMLKHGLIDDVTEEGWHVDNHGYKG